MGCHDSSDDARRPIAAIDAALIDRTLRDVAAERDDGKTFCPSEVARRLADDWRPLMERVRERAALLAAAGELQATQGGRPVEIATARGPIRLRRTSADGADR